MNDLNDANFNPEIVSNIDGLNAYDGFDIIAELAYSLTKKTREQRFYDFRGNEKTWLNGLPENTRKVIIALCEEFAKFGINAFEDKEVFQIPRIKTLGGAGALICGSYNPGDLILNVKDRIYM